MRRIMVDIDNTICVTEGSDYVNAKPIKNRIDRVNELSKDNIIIYYTSRGYVSRIDYSKITERQLKEWGCKYTLLLMDKPNYDLFICDRAQNAMVLDI